MVESRRYRIPPILSAVVTGLVVMLAGSYPWSLLVVFNIKCGAFFPWASVVVAGYLAVYLAYLNGWGPPCSTAATRRRRLRARALPRQVWRWALVAGGTANAALADAFIVVSRFGWINHSREPYPVAPPWTIAAWLLTGAAVAGIAEESAFRGYMQKMLEERYRAPIAIAITSAVFGAAHLTHGFSVAVLFDAAWGSVYGALAYYTGSILPSLVLHVSLDALEFFLVWRFAGAPAPPLVRLDNRAWFAIGAGAALAMLACWSFRRLAQLHGAES